MSEFDTNLPSTRQIQNLIKDKKDVEVKLVTNDLLVGKLFWQDKNCIALMLENNEQTILWRHGIVYVKPKS